MDIGCKREVVLNESTYLSPPGFFVFFGFGGIG